MATKLDNKCSFRGVYFNLPERKRKGGPNFATHEFAGADDAAHQFVGRAPDEFSVSGELVGDDATDARNQMERLRAAFDEAAPGELNHPLWGRLQVVLKGGYEFSEVLTKLNLISFSATFQRYGRLDRPTESINPLGQLESHLREAMVAVEEMLTKNFAVSGLAQIENATNSINGILDGSDELSQSLAAGSDQAAYITRNGARARSRVSALIRDPSALVTALRSSLSGIPGLLADQAYGTKHDAFAGMLAGIRKQFEALRRPLNSNEAQIHLNDVLLYLFQSTAGIVSMILSYVDSAPAGDDVHFRNRIVGEVDSFAARPEVADNLNLQRALVNARTRLLRNFPSEGRRYRPQALDLPEASSRPLLLILYDFYGRIPTREEYDQVVKINGFGPDLYVRGPLEVVSAG